MDLYGAMQAIPAMLWLHISPCTTLQNVTGFLALQAIGAGKMKAMVVYGLFSHAVSSCLRMQCWPAERHPALGCQFTMFWAGNINAARALMFVVLSKLGQMSNMGLW